MILGILLAFQFRAVSNFPGLPLERTQELASELRQLTEENKKLLHAVEEQREKLRQVNAGQKEAVEALRSELEQARMAAGLIPATGPGVEVILENPKGLGDEIPSDLFIIRDEDLLSLVNELRSAGAEAISINGQRVVASSEIRFAGSFINVNTTRVVPPYQVLAVGAPESLEETLTMPGGLFDYFNDLGIKVKVVQHEELTVPAYAEKLSYQFAKPNIEG